MEKNTNVPKLRFSEFEGEWVEKKLGNIYNFKTTNSFTRDNLNYEEGIVKNIHYGDIHKKFKSHFDITKELVPFVNNEILLNKSSAENYCKEGDIIIADASEDYVDIGKSIEIVNLNNEKVIAGLHTLHASPDLQMLAIGFGAHLMKSENIRLQIKTIAQGTKVLSITSDRLSNVILIIPTLPEQTKIASFLTAADDKLTQLKKKKSLLEEYKKGVMQQIFSQELRFKDDNGEDFPEWEEKRLEDVTNIRSGLSKDQNGNLEGYKVTRIETISDGTINQEKVGYIDLVDHIEDYKLAKGDILFSNINSVSHIGKTAIAYSDLDLYHGMNLLCLKCFNSTNPFFLFYFLNLEKSRVYFRSVCNQAVNQASINQTELAKTSILVPSLPEQTKIAKFLSAIDEKINHCSKQIERMEDWKKGLLQQMFV